MTVTVTGERSVKEAFDALVSNTNKFVADALLVGGLLVETEAKRSIQDQSPGTPQTRYRDGVSRDVIAAADGFPPNRDLGDLSRSIVTVPRSDFVVVGVIDGQMRDRANWLEFGTVKMGPKPFLIPAFIAKQAEILEVIEKAVARATAEAQKGVKA